MKKYFIFISFTLAFALLPNSAKAFTGAVSTATGGTGRGAVEPVDGVYLNPSIIADLPHKNFAVNFSADKWALSISDNGEDAYFPAAMHFVSQASETLSVQQLGLTFATPRFKKISLGLTASMIEYDQHITSTGQLTFRQSTLDLGFSFAFNKNFGFGLVANRVVASKIQLAENLQLASTVSMGMSYTYRDFARLRFDIESGPKNSTDRLAYMAGIENYLSDWMVFRLGYKNDNVVSKNYITSGLGFAGPQFGLHYAFISNPANRTEDQHLIDLGIPF